MEELVKDLIARGYLQSPAVIAAFRKIDRKDFVPEAIKHLAYIDEALPIGHGQTISQPLTVAFMLERLTPRPGDKILDIGTGSGWKAALLAYIVNPENQKPKLENKKSGRVTSIERIPELYQMAKTNIGRYQFLEMGTVELILGDGSRGWLPAAPYDKIISGAAAAEIPRPWLDQLKAGGQLLAPLSANKLVELNKLSATEFDRKEYPGFVFVPLIPD